MHTELVSVIIPTYKRAHILPRAIKSVLNQTYSNLELIIIDDGSRDNTSAVVSDVKDKRIRYIESSENKGLSSARNTGLRASQGEFVAFLDDDDEWIPDKLQSSLDVFRKNQGSNIGLVYTNGYLVKKSKKNIFFKDSRQSSTVYTDTQRQKNIFPTSISSPLLQFCMLPKSVVLKTGFFDECIRNWEDVDFFVRVASVFDVYFLNIPLAIIHEQDQHLGMVNADVMKSREYFFGKHRDKISKDRNNLYRFNQKMARDWLMLGDKRLARNYFLKALKIKPYKVELVGKILRSL
jgi:glycosyltransferase involved in cell wall biosynthesis